MLLPKYERVDLSFSFFSSEITFQGRGIIKILKYTENIIMVFVQGWHTKLNIGELFLQLIRWAHKNVSVDQRDTPVLVLQKKIHHLQHELLTGSRRHCTLQSNELQIWRGAATTPQDHISLVWGKWSLVLYQGRCPTTVGDLPLPWSNDSL